MTSRQWFGIVVAMVWLPVACATTQLGQVWQDPAFKGAPVTKVMVIGVAENQQNRQMFENLLAEQFAANGIPALASNRVLPSDQKLSRDQIKQAAVARQCQAVLITHLVSVEEKEINHAPDTPASDLLAHRDTLGAYYGVVFDAVHLPGHTAEREHVELQTSLYHTDSEQLIWQAVSKSVDPPSGSELVRQVSRLLVDRLKASGLLASRP